MEFEPSDLGYFREAVALTAKVVHGFRLVDIASVPLAWQIIDGATSSFGWVVVLRHGRCVYLQYVVDEEAAQPEPRDLVVRTVNSGQSLPPLAGPDMHWFEPRHVNLALGLPTRRGAVG